MISQLAMTAIGALLASLFMGPVAAFAALYGGAVALSNTLLLAWRASEGAGRPVQDPRRELAWVIRSSMERFFWVSLLLAAGLGWMKLMPLPMLAGFALGQLTLVVSTIISGIEKQ